MFNKASYFEMKNSQRVMFSIRNFLDKSEFARKTAFNYQMITFSDSVKVSKMAKSCFSKKHDCVSKKDPKKEASESKL